ncbi:MAG: methyl-accepting chemotaxis protein [Myxococcota bacterium]
MGRPTLDAGLHPPLLAKLVRRAGDALAVGSIALLALGFGAKSDGGPEAAVSVYLSGAGLLLGIAVRLLEAAAHTVLAAGVAFVGGTGVAVGLALAGGDTPAGLFGYALLHLWAGLGALTTRRLVFGAWSVLCGACLAGLGAHAVSISGSLVPAVQFVFFIFFVVVFSLLRSELELRDRLLAERTSRIESAIELAQSVAGRDPQPPAEPSTVELKDAFEGMLTSLRQRLAELGESAEVVATISSNIDEMASQQQRGAVNQFQAIKEMRQTIQTMVRALLEIHRSSQEVLENAASTQATNERAQKELTALAGHTNRINELLEVVTQIASKSELLALNASLEGVRAGHEGRGFLLVASELQQLAEHTGRVIGDVKSMTEDIGRSRAATVVSMDRATKLARATTEASNAISSITQQQSTEAERVLAAMSDVALVTEEIADSAEDASVAIAELHRLTGAHREAFRRFEL